jgi:hypothetical protein
MQIFISGETTVPTNLYERKNELISKPPDHQTIEKPMESCMSEETTTNLHERKNELILKPSDHQTPEKSMQSCMSGELTEPTNLYERKNELILKPSDHQTLEKPMESCMSEKPTEPPNITVPTNFYVRKNELILQPSDRKNIKRVMHTCMNNRFMTKDFDFIWNPDEFYKNINIASKYPKVKSNNGSSQSKKALKRYKPTNLISNQESENQEIGQLKVEIKSPQSKRSKTVLNSHEINEKQLEKPVEVKKKKSKAEMASEKFDERFKKAFKNQKGEKECLKDSTKKQKQETKVKLQSLKMTSNTVPLSTLMQKRPKKQNVRCS